MTRTAIRSPRFVLEFGDEFGDVGDLDAGLAAAGSVDVFSTFRRGAMSTP
jgi:hypothetical protein